MVNRPWTTLLRLDILAGLLELIGLYIIGRKSRVGFAINLIACSLWLVVALQTKVYGLVLVAVPALAINAHYWSLWGEKTQDVKYPGR